MAAHDAFVDSANFSSQLDGGGFLSAFWQGAGADSQWAAPTPLLEAGTGSLFASHTDVHPTVPSLAHDGLEDIGVGGLWWERVHVLPRRIDLGNILSTVDTTIDVFNADRFASRTWSDFVNNAGAGTDLLGETLPEVFDSLEGRLFTFRVTTEGPAEVSATLDYTFSGQGLTLQPITFTRLVVFPYRPEEGFAEELEWFTDILESDDGTEQRIALREFPRQFFEFELTRDEGAERGRLESRLFDRQELPWGVPFWPAGARLRLAASATDVLLTVYTTAYSDLRVGENVILWQDELNWETARVTAVTPTTVSLGSPLVSNYPVGTELFALRTAVLVGSAPSRRPPRGLARYGLRFQVTENVTTLGSVQGWSTYDGKVLLDDFNFVEGEHSEALEIPVLVVDNAVGRIIQTSASAVSDRVSAKTFLTRNAQELHRVRQLFYALRGRQVSFYLPTFARELVPAVAPISGSNLLDIVNVGYSTFVAARAPRNVLRLVKTDGTSLIREVANASEISSSVERLTLNSTWPGNIPLAEIEFVDYVELVRLAEDKVRFEHGVPGRARVRVPVRTVPS